jgi:hypothetical protein
MIKLSVLFIFLISVSKSALGQNSPPFDLEHSKTYFEEARKVSEKDSSRLWGRPLYGPIFFVDEKNHAVIANQADSQGLLHPEGGLYIGKLDGIDPSNDDVEWAGKHWTMMIWQTISEDRLAREKLFAHEMFHRIQRELKLTTMDSLSQHLDSKEGRIWLLLEWRALAAALMSSGPSQNLAVKDALTFREYRRKLFADAAEKENNLEIAEGIAEYTGLVAASPDNKSAKWSAIAALSNPDLSKTFVRAFAYTSGPAYGLLLDDRRPGWRKKISIKSDLGKILSSTQKGPLGRADLRAAAYGVAAIRNSEEDRADKFEVIKARYRKILVDGFKLILPRTENIKFTFNPSALVSLDDKGIVYPTLKVIADWGTIDVSDGALLPQDRSLVTVAAPPNTTGSRIEGPGWILNLNRGWQIVPSTKHDGFLLQRSSSL